MAESKTVPLVPDATNLSWLAETADGIRDVDLALYVDEHENLQLMKTSEFGGKPLVTVRTKKHRPYRIPVTEVACRGVYKDDPANDSAEGDKHFEATLPSNKDYDAVFWTESSIEKFLYPYYRAHRLWDDTMERLKEQFEHDDFAVAIAHRAPSKSSSVAPTAIQVGVVEGEKLTWMTVDAYLLTAPRSRSKGSRAK